MTLARCDGHSSAGRVGLSHGEWRLVDGAGMLAVGLGCLEIPPQDPTRFARAVGGRIARWPRR
ncbi:MAG: hypothetical protein ACKOJF_12240, partial [Planctomycetaceae bacterium]